MGRAMADADAPDFITLARRPSERLAIASHVRDAPTLEETDYLEWKSAYDLSSKPGAAAIARQFIGMANRDFAQAERHAEGSAYVLLGVEPGMVHGVPHWDSADIENWLARYVQPELRYDAHYVEIDGKEVLVFTVDAPRQGDPIYCLQRMCEVEEVVKQVSAGQEEKRIKKTLPKGAIYVRHGGKTEQHTPEDLRRLGARLAVAERPTLDVAVMLDTSKAVAIIEGLASDACRDARLRAWSERMLAKLPRREPRLASGKLGLVNFPSIDYAIRFPGRSLGETRSEEEYKAEVEMYVQAMKTPGAWLQAVAVEWVEAKRAMLGVSVRNNTEQNYESAVIELTLVGLTRGNVFAAEGDAARRLRVPEEPEEWGSPSYMTGLLASRYATTAIAVLPKPRPDIEEPNRGQVLARYPELRIRPHTTHRLEPLLLALAPFMVGKSVPVHWRVTTSSTEGHQEGDIDFRVPMPPSSGAPEPSEAQAQT
jgi:Putative DNA-binding domain